MVPLNCHLGTWGSSSLGQQVNKGVSVQVGCMVPTMQESSCWHLAQVRRGCLECGPTGRLSFTLLNCD